MRMTLEIRDMKQQSLLHDTTGSTGRAVNRQKCPDVLDVPKKTGSTKNWEVGRRRTRHACWDRLAVVCRPTTPDNWEGEGEANGLHRTCIGMIIQGREYRHRQLTFVFWLDRRHLGQMHTRKNAARRIVGCAASRQVVVSLLDVGSAVLSGSVSECLGSDSFALA